MKCKGIFYIPKLHAEDVLQWLVLSSKNIYVAILKTSRQDITQSALRYFQAVRTALPLLTFCPIERWTSILGMSSRTSKKIRMNVSVRGY